MNVKGMIIYNNKNIKVLDVTVDDNSYRYRVIKGDHNLTLHYSLAEHVEIPVGSYCIYQGERYTLERPEAFKMKHSRNFEYTVTLESNQAKAKIWKFRNPVDGRLKFSLTAKPIEHLQMFVDNMNRRDTGWEVGECIDGTETLINYNHVYCWDALGMMATEFNTEFEFVGKTVHLRKVEYNKNNPLPLSYGRGNGFKPGVGRSNYGDTPPIEILYVQGGTDNIDPSKYKSSELLLPAGQNIQYDGVYFEGDPNFNPANARTYVVDDLGYSIRRSDKELSSLAEDSLDCSDIYPKRIGKVTSVVVEDADNNFYDIVDNTIPNTLNYEECLIEGETMTIVFQSGMLAGREFEVKYYHNAEKGKAARRFEIVPAEIDGQTMPNATFAPQTTDTYVVFKCRMPDAYVRDDETKTGASWDMFRTAVRYLFDNEEQKFSFTGELDGIWSKKDWINISGKIRLGGYIQFSDEHFQKDGVLVRITGIKDYINKPHSPEIELSNSTVGGSFSTTLKQLESDEVLVEDYHRDAIQFTKRRFRDAKETMEMLEDALLDNFTQSISPITIQTMQMLVGDESLQFRFVNSKTNPVGVAHSITYDNTTKQLTAAAGIIQHLTIGISSLSSSHAASEYRYWDMPEYTSGRLDNGETKYYLYAKVSKTAQTGVFLLSETAIALEGVSGYYHLLVGVLNSEYDGERSFATLYGFSEILPGRITTDRVVSGDGNSYFDMLANALRLGDALDFNSAGDGKLRLKGTLVQSQSGDESYIGCYRGVYNPSYTYYNGDEVTYTYNGTTSTYRYIYATPSKGVAPTNTTYWQVVAQGSEGKKGVGVSKVEEFYLISNSKTGVTVNTSGWSWSVQTPTKEKRYLWNYECVTYSDGSYVNTAPVIIGMYSEDGRGIKSVTEYYARSISNSSAPSSWNTTPPTLTATYKYLWNYEVITYTDDTTSKTTPAVIGVYGDTGKAGQYTEVRFAKNGSTTTPPSLTKTALNPSGWTTTTPSVGTAEYLWMTKAEKSGDGTQLLTQWTTPVRITPYDGKDGADGKSPAMVYRGVYDSTKTYYGNQYRLDCVKQGDTYYIARIDAGTFTNIAPPNTSKWNVFGAQFESVATQLLLAQYANIGNFVIKDNCIISQKGTINGVASTDYSNPNFVPNIMLDGQNGQSVLCGSQRSPFVRYDGSYYVGSDFSSLAECYDNLVFPVSNTGSWELNINFPWSKKCNGRKVTLVNYKWKNETPSGKFEISAPTGKYFYEDGLQKDKLQFSREVIELLGYGDDTTFFGWIVIGRHDIATVSRYGREFKVLAMGEVTGTKSGASIKYHTFDGSTLSVSRSGTGNYLITHSSQWFASLDDRLVICSGKGYSAGGSSPIKATYVANGATGIRVLTSDDDSENDGSFQFLIANLANWSYD